MTKWIDRKWFDEDKDFWLWVKSRKLSDDIFSSRNWFVSWGPGRV